MNQIVLTSLARLLGQFPTLLTLLAGIVIFLVLMRRSPRACIPAAVSFGLLFLAGVGQVFVTNALIWKRQEAGWSVPSLATVLSINGLLFGLLHAGGLGMLIAAVLAGRTGKA